MNQDAKSSALLLAVDHLVSSCTQLLLLVVIAGKVRKLGLLMTCSERCVLLWFSYAGRPAEYHRYYEA